MTRRLALTLQLSALALAALMAAPAQAATQILGLVASNGVPTPLHCEGGVCRSFVNSFCLQWERPAPALDSEYQLAPGGGLTVIARRADGSEVRLPGQGLVTIRVDAGFTSVTISLPQVRLRDLGAVSSAIEISPLTSILPVHSADDPDPQSTADIAEATGPTRRLAAEIFEGSGEDSDAAKLIGLLINGLPPDGGLQTVALDDLFRQVVATVGPGRISAEGFAAAERIAKGCESFPPNSAALGFCLEVQQAGLLGTLNEQLWDATGGS